MQNTIFGAISQDFLPPGYGEILGKTQRPVDDPDPPTLEQMDHYDGLEDWKIFGGEGIFGTKKDDTGASTDTSTDTAADTGTAGGSEDDVERGAFWKNLASSGLTGLFNKQASSTVDFLRVFCMLRV